MSDRPKRSRGSIDDVFGEAFPQIPADERGAPEPDDDADRDRWMRENRPPHHT